MHYSAAPRLTQPEPPKDKGGRPTDYSPALAEHIVERIAETVLSVRRLCEDDPEFPSRAAINRWRRKHPEFAEAYDMAMEGRVEDMRWDCVEIADEAAEGSTATVAIEGVDRDVPVRDDLAYVKLQLDERHKLIESLAPKPAEQRAPDEPQQLLPATPLRLPMPQDDPVKRASESWALVVGK